MAAYYRFNISGENLRELEKNLLDWEKQLLKTDSFCLYTLDSNGHTYYSCKDVDIDDVALIQYLEKSDITPESIKMEDFVSAIKLPGFFRGSGQWFIDCRK